MTDGERMVFATAFVNALERGGTPAAASLWAASAVNCLRSDPVRITDDVRAMLADMLGRGGAR